jgi:uncharacterized protein Usg
MNANETTDSYSKIILEIKNNISKQLKNSTGYRDEDGNLPPFSINTIPEEDMYECDSLRRESSKNIKLLNLRARVIFMRSDLTQIIDKINIRNLNHISQAYDSISTLPELKDIVKNEKFDISLLIKELLLYHSKIIGTRNWKSKFKLISNNEKYFKRGKIYHEYGFPQPDSECYLTKMEAHYNNSRNYHDFDASLEAWLYSFWNRRFNEGTIEITHSILKWVIKDK